MSRESGGTRAMMQLMGEATITRPPFAPPFLVDGEAMIAQAANILFYLGPKLRLAPADEADRLFVHQLELTVTDLVAEAHDVHHPVGNHLYYEDQKAEALRAAKSFRDERIPKYLGYFERVLAANPSKSGHLVGNALSYVDLSVFQVIEGLCYAFPIAMARLRASWPGLHALHGRIAGHERVAAYLASERRIPFNEDGIFRHYPELDG